jgi:hypothetical protein
VFIGQEMNEHEIREELTDCLCTKEEIASIWQLGDVPDEWPILNTFL